MSMSASASQLTKPTKRTAEEASVSSSTSPTSSWRAMTQPDAVAATWKRVKTDLKETPLTQPPQHRPMLGAWFGVARAASAHQQAVQSQQSMSVRAKTEATITLSQDSEDDKPLARLATARVQHQHVQPRDWKQQKELQRLQAKTKTTSSPPQAKSGFTTAREAAKTQPQEGRNGVSTARVDAPAATRVQSNDDERAFQLSSKRRVTVRRWKSAVLVDIREYYDDNGVSKPGKKGISLAKDQWNTLMRMAHVIDEAVELVENDRVDGHCMNHVKERVPVNEERTIAFTLSSKRRITVGFFRAAVLIDLREYYEQGGEMKPGKKGISLSKEQWRSLQQTEAEISQAIEEV